MYILYTVCSIHYVNCFIFSGGCPAPSDLTLEHPTFGECMYMYMYIHCTCTYTVYIGVWLSAHEQWLLCVRVW